MLTTQITKYVAFKRTQGLRPKSVQNIEYALFRFARYERKTMTGTVKAWLKHIEKLQPTGKVSEASIIRGFLIHVKSPAAQLVPRYKLPRTVPRAQCSQAVESLFQVLPDARAKVIVGLMLWCGLRVGEVATLQVGDLDLRAKTIFVTGKGGHQRLVPMPTKMNHAIKTYLVESGGRFGPLIRSSQGRQQQLSTAYISQLVTGWMRDAGIKTAAYDGVSAHALRHTAASRTLDACSDVTVVQRMLGHQKLATTAVYLRVAAIGDIRKAMEKAAA